MLELEYLNIKDKLYSLKKLKIDQPQNNRKLLLKYLKKQKGIYIFKSLDNTNIYVGHSINLYSRINSYFMKSILETRARRVLKYFYKYGFENFTLLVYLLEDLMNFNDLINL